jgi:FkbM family methyltransferase
MQHSDGKESTTKTVPAKSPEPDPTSSPTEPRILSVSPSTCAGTQAPDQTRAVSVCRHGNFVFPDDAYIGKSLEVYGEYCEDEVQFVLELIEDRAECVIVEAGANIGALTVPIANASEVAMVYAFEPQADMHRLLVANLKENVELRAVRTFPSGLGAKEEMMHYVPNVWNTGNVSLFKGETDHRHAHSARVLTLDGFELERLDLLKADVEGMELGVILGAKKTIAKHRPYLYLENDRPEMTGPLFDEIFGLSYRIFHHMTPLARPDNFRGVTENIFGNTVTLNIVCVPEELPLPKCVAGLVETKPNQWAAVCRFGGIGDNFIAASVLPGLARMGNRIEFITNDLAGDVLRNNPWIDKLSICRDGDQPPGGGFEWQMWFEKRRHEYGGGLFHLSHTVETSLALVQGQAAFWWPPAMRRKLCGPSYVEFANAIVDVPVDYRPLFYPTAFEKAKALETKERLTANATGRRFIGVVLAGSRFDKVYPHLPLAVARLIRELDATVLLVGRPGKEHDLAKTVEKIVFEQNGSVENLFLAMTVHSAPEGTVGPPGPAADWPIRRVLSQLLTCDLVIGPDSGPMWAVAFEHSPAKIMLLSHASQENITKHWRTTYTLHADPKRVPCWPCHRLHDTVDTCILNKDKSGAACISDISVEAILKAAKEVFRD